MANDIFRDFLDIFLIMYLDDLLIYSKTQEDHDIHVRKVLERLREYGLYAKLEKCSFDCNEVEFSDYTISSKGIFMYPTKVQTILEWQSQCSVRDFCRKFIWNYSKIVLPLNQLTKKNQAFVSTIEADTTFPQLKEAST